MEHIWKFQEFCNSMTRLETDSYEYAYLKAIVLFSPGETAFFKNSFLFITLILETLETWVTRKELHGRVKMNWGNELSNSELPDHPGVDGSEQIEKFQEKALMELQDYVQKTYPDDTYRYMFISCINSMCYIPHHYQQSINIYINPAEYHEFAECKLRCWCCLFSSDWHASWLVFLPCASWTPASRRSSSSPAWLVTSPSTASFHTSSRWRRPSTTVRTRSWRTENLLVSLWHPELCGKVSASGNLFIFQQWNLPLSLLQSQNPAATPRFVKRAMQSHSGNQDRLPGFGQPGWHSECFLLDLDVFGSKPALTRIKTILSSSSSNGCTRLH